MWRIRWWHVKRNKGSSITPGTKGQLILQKYNPTKLGTPRGNVSCPANNSHYETIQEATSDVTVESPPCKDAEFSKYFNFSLAIFVNIIIWSSALNNREVCPGISPSKISLEPDQHKLYLYTIIFHSVNLSLSHHLQLYLLTYIIISVHVSFKPHI